MFRLNCLKTAMKLCMVFHVCIVDAFVSIQNVHSYSPQLYSTLTSDAALLKVMFYEIYLNSCSVGMLHFVRISIMEKQLWSSDFMLFIHCAKCTLMAKALASSLEGRGESQLSAF